MGSTTSIIICGELHAPGLIYTIVVWLTLGLHYSFLTAKWHTFYFIKQRKWAACITRKRMSKLVIQCQTSRPKLDQMKDKWKTWNFWYLPSIIIKHIRIICITVEVVSDSNFSVIVFFFFSFLSYLFECPRVSSVHIWSDIYYINSFDEL